MKSLLNSLRINHQDLRAYWGWFFAWGVLIFLLGIIAISAATFTTLLSVILLGFLILIGGAIVLVDTFTFWWGRWPGFTLHLIMSLIYIILGIMLINNPVVGSVTLTLFLGIFFILIGISRIIYSLSVRVIRWQWSFINGFISLLLGFLIVTNLPTTSLFIIGVFIGVDLLLCGLAYMMIALGAKRLLT